MKRNGLILTTLLSLFPLIATPAAAGAWRAGDGFQAGGVYFHVVSVTPEGGALFRVAERLEADGVEEHPGCYRVGRTFYHHEACPVLQAHFERFGAAADSAPPAATTAAAAYGTGSHPIDYLRGGYVEPERSAGWRYAGLYYGPWLRTAGRPVGFRGRPGFGFRGGGGRFGGFAHGLFGPRFVSVSIRHW